MNSRPAGQCLCVEDTASPASSDEPQVGHRVEDGIARLTIAGELIDTARRPLVRVITDLLLTQPAPTRVELDLSGITFMNSAGMAVLVQLQRLAAPRGIEVALVHPTAAVVRPLQLSGLWHRFPIEGAQSSSEAAGS
ncbi:STAS domain-containing protein [Blastococcus haudaquaticus]|uniref:Anti-sigma factor antagonist n=1 Tax=Blastococcus haudaquaticus TaxID=1938745 RepID=A0A286GW29_9ACTN|nr:STAS domain-containing protein [Blastococcus haudaquaticus]SOD99289.1 stage II sporulation protein AA (anti-sigma F factor antagonist) [Blastococcus haudaquaticus]